MERFGLVGLPNAGKSSLYNALTGGGALAAPYPFATKDPNIGVAKVPDERVERLAVMSKTKTLVHAAVAGRRHRRPRRGRVEGRGPGQQVPRQHPRGRRHRVRAACVRRRRRHRAERPDRAPACGRDRVGPRRPGDRREAAQPGHTPGQARQARCGRARSAAGRVRQLGRGPAAVPRRPQARAGARR